MAPWKVHCGALGAQHHLAPCALLDVAAQAPDFAHLAVLIEEIASSNNMYHLIDPILARCTSDVALALRQPLVASVGSRLCVLHEYSPPKGILLHLVSRRSAVRHVAHNCSFVGLGKPRRLLSHSGPPRCQSTGTPAQPARACSRPLLCYLAPYAQHVEQRLEKPVASYLAG